MDGSAIGGAIASLKTAGEIAGTFLKIRDQAQIQAKVIELQTTILTAQQSALASQSEQRQLEDEKRELEREIADLKAWDRQKSRYQLAALGGSVFAYALKYDSADGEPQHRACSNCFEQGRRSILQCRRVHLSNHFYVCNACSAEIRVSEPESNRTQSLPVQVVRGPNDWMA